MSEGKSEFGVSNLEYNLVTTMSNLLQGTEALAQYSKDAVEAGRRDVAEALDVLRQANITAAQVIRSALAEVIASSK
jgi:hypothetical protein